MQQFFCKNPRGKDLDQLMEKENGETNSIRKPLANEKKSGKIVRIRLAEKSAKKTGIFPINELEFETAKWYRNIKKKC